MSDDTGGALPGGAVLLRHADSRQAIDTVTDAAGQYQLAAAAAGRYDIRFSLVNFSHLSRVMTLAAGESRVVDVVLPLALTAKVTITGVRTFRNVADVERPDETLIGRRTPLLRERSRRNSWRIDP